MHVPGAQASDMGGTRVRRIGIARAKARVGTKSLTCNRRRAAYLDGCNHRRPHQGRGMDRRISAQAFKQGPPEPPPTRKERSQLQGPPERTRSMRLCQVNTNSGHVWLNAVEAVFAGLTRETLENGVFQSPVDLHGPSTPLSPCTTTSQNHSSGLPTAWSPPPPSAGIKCWRLSVSAL